MTDRPGVLIVEDHAEMRKVIASLLSDDYAIVGEIEDGNTALDAAVAIQPHLVLLDISLPGRSGMQLLPEIRSALSDAAIVVVTNKAEPVYREEAFRRGADEFVDKSRISTELLSAISAALKARGLAQTA